MYFVSGKYRKSILEVYLKYIIIVFETPLNLFIE